MGLRVIEKFSTYPENVHSALSTIRTLIFNVAAQDNIQLLETIKWGEPSYVSKIGSTIRFDWKPKYPEQYCIYFNCKTTLIETFKEIYGDTFNYEGNRAIVLTVGQLLPAKELAHCISLSLRYKNIRQFNLLGA
jgi:hypothetical protein